MTRLMSCDEFAERLSDFLERDSRVLDDSTRVSMERHALSCAECGALVADLRELRVAAGSLPVLVPSRDLWAGVAAQIETPVVQLNRGGVPASQSRSRFSRRAWLGLAAAALVAVTATVTREMSRRAAPIEATSASPSPVSRVAAATADSTMSAPKGVASEASDSSATLGRGAAAPGRATLSLASNAQTKVSPEVTYDREIEKLRVIVDQRQSDLDSSTVAVISHNLRIIDDAIAQCRTALKKDPASRFLMQSLDDALDTKVQMMRTVAMLPSRS
jgi:hypothetical protein